MNYDYLHLSTVPKHPIMDAEDESKRLRALLRLVLDAGRPHSHLCDCDQCAAWLAVRKELKR